MENRLYPTWEQLAEQNNPLTEGERTLLEFLDEHLPRDVFWKKGQPLKDYNGWLIFAQPFLNGARPDVVVFHPQVGVMIYEVKDWDLRHYSSHEGQLHVSDVWGSYRKKSPIDQVNHYKAKLIGQLVPAIGEAIDRDAKKYALIKTGLYFHNATTIKCKEVIGPRLKKPEYYPLIGSDRLHKNFLDEIVPHLPFVGRSAWDTRWNEEVLFWLKPPFHSIEQGKLLRLKYNQTKVAEPMPGHHRVRGVAGSGKTQALAYRAGKLASQGKDVLVITFNITLWHYIRDMIARAPFNFEWDRITFTHFHGFCKDKLNEFGKHWPGKPDEEGLDHEELQQKREQFFTSTVTDAVIDAVQEQSYQKYDAILIDEGQDYHYEWYAMLSKYFVSAHDEVVVVCDKRQNIFGRELAWLDKRVTRAGLEKFKDDYIDLTVTYRLPAKVAVMTNEFSELFSMNQELKVGRVADNPVLMHSQHIVWLNIEAGQWQDFVVKAFKRLKREGYSASDMVILLSDHEIGMQAVRRFEEMGVSVNHVFHDIEEDEEKVGRKSKRRLDHHKKAFWMGDGRLKMSTIHSFKGWELLNIVLYIPPNTPHSAENTDAVVYTALTRTRENLIVLNANERYKTFGEKLPKHWKEQ